MKINFIHFRHILSASIQVSVMIVIMLLTSLGSAAQYYNDTRTVVILPNRAETQRPVQSSVSQDTWNFCSDDNFVYISSSTTGRKVNHDYCTYLQFSLATIPEGAIIDTVDLMIYLKNVKNTSSVFEQGVNLYELSTARSNLVINITDSSSTALSLVSKSNIDQAIHLRPDITDGANWVPARKGNFYCVLAAEEAETYRYYTARSNDMAKQPKLVISYHMPFEQVRRKSWPQYKYDAQHTGMLGWQSNSTATGFKLSNAYSPVGANYIKSDPLLNDDKLVMAYQTSTSEMYRMLSLSRRGSTWADSYTDAFGLVKYGPIGDRKGNVYSMMGNTAGALYVFAPDSWQVIYDKQLENSAQATAIPVIGFDGSIYISTNKGIYAYTPQPECKLKWIYTSGANVFGTVALNEAEQIVYVYDGNSGNVTALNSIDGIKKWDKNIGSTFIADVPVPSVKNDILCVTNNQRKGNRFYILDANTGKGIDSIITGEDLVISQPVIGTNKVFVINNGALESYALSDGTKQSAAGIAGLNPASALVMDGNDNVYVLNTEQGKQSLTMVAPGATSFPSLPISDANGYLAGNRLIIVPDGSLFTGNDNHLYGILPSGLSVKDDITIPFNNASEFKSEYLYRSEGMVRVAGKALTGTQNIVIHGGRGIGFQPGFNVKKGATLSCKSGL
ncbi:outer membrane protein assembly factor BamB family protein [Chitinophaga ginsengisoli]|uniref:Outer membrane protein assembly factor BamB n=1 Tax=Chitinophaga ginsengisoli TaxID=363837 RepID=A0A2P8GLQ3_9BACT|nr:PQQ-binding-like beta-propeller repeat protein [Chitinophaga ginsengisoli]PSL34902.1 outer membrane protein assembly factor BamB [Chitinophaga ginsengisoli]